METRGWRRKQTPIPSPSSDSGSETSKSSSTTSSNGSMQANVAFVEGEELDKIVEEGEDDNSMEEEDPDKMVDMGHNENIMEEDEGDIADKIVQEGEDDNIFEEDEGEESDKVVEVGDDENIFEKEEGANKMVEVEDDDIILGDDDGEDSDKVVEFGDDDVNLEDVEEEEDVDKMVGEGENNDNILEEVELEKSDKIVEVEDDDHIVLEDVEEQKEAPDNIVPAKLSPYQIDPDTYFPDEAFDSDSDFDEQEVEEHFSPPQTPGLSLENAQNEELQEEPILISPPEDLGEIFKQLIINANALGSEATTNETFDREMTRNLNQGHAAVEHILKGFIGQTNEPRPSKKAKAGPGDISRALQHTKAASEVIRTKAERIGNSSTQFALDVFLGSFRNAYIADTGEYSPQLAAANIAMESSKGSIMVSPLLALIGAYDREREEVSAPKRKKAVRRPHPEDEMDVVAAQEGSTLTVDDHSSMPQVLQNQAEKISKALHRKLQRLCQSSPEPVNLFEFLIDKSSFQKTMENIFCFAFLVKDGLVSLTKEEKGNLHDLSYSIKPEKWKKPDEEGARNQMIRFTFILSFSPRQWKGIVPSSKADNVSESLPLQQPAEIQEP